MAELRAALAAEQAERRKSAKQLGELKRQGTTMLLVEQNINVALGLADRAYVLRTGEVSLTGSAAELRDNYERVAEAYLGARQ